ncbi:MAG: hypothetical protein ACE366_03745 [Bradymonadia bacterium]
MADAPIKQPPRPPVVQRHRPRPVPHVVSATPTEQRPSALKQFGIKAFRRLRWPTAVYLLWSLSFGWSINALLGFTVIYVALFIALPDILDL